MKASAVRVLVTRPEPENARTAAALKARGHDVLLAPLLAFEPIADAPIGAGPFAALLLTSANAVRALREHPQRETLRALAVLAVGARTADAARAAGFADVRSANGDARDLAALARRAFGPDTPPLLHLAGEDHVGLRHPGLGVETAVVYRMRPAAALPEPARDALRSGNVDAVLHYSPRTAEAFLACLRAAGISASGLKAPQLCLSAAVAAPLREAGAAAVLVAPQPNEDALLGLMDTAG